MVDVSRDTPPAPPPATGCRLHSTTCRLSALLEATKPEHDPMPYMYILECADRSLYVGSARNLEHRLAQHSDGEGAAYTRTRLPVRLLYFEKFDRVDDAYRREKQVQGWSRSKRLALVKGQLDKLPPLSRKDFSWRRGDNGDVSRETQ